MSNHQRKDLELTFIEWLQIVQVALLAVYNIFLVYDVIFNGGRVVVGFWVMVGEEWLP